jgi:Domain of unknown function (DUF222)/HNH endonuclease
MVKTPREVSPAGADHIAAAAALSDEEIAARLDGLFRQKAAVEGSIVVLLGEVGRRQAYRSEGATATEPWAVERFGVSVPTARALAHLGELASDIPHLVESLCVGELSLDKVRALADVATAETERQLAEEATACSVRQLGDVARRAAATRGPRARSKDDRRSVRFNEQCRTMTVQLPPASFAETRSCLEARARAVPSDGETPFDERLCDAFLELVRSSGRAASATTTSPYVVVVHVPLAALVEASGEESALVGELERDGLVSAAVVRQIACDATLAVAVDDDVGHTMYEGRARREPNPAQRREVVRRDRHCRFPGCANVTFTNTHHVVPWKPGGRTDLENLALMCVHHHHLVHSTGWEMTGNANEELTFVGPSGRVMTTRPSPLWTSVTAGPRSGLSS